MKSRLLDPLSEEARAIVSRPWEAAVRRARAERPGTPVVGVFPVFIPFEIVRASGALPLALFGGGGEVEVARADARFQSFVCSIAKTTLELGLRGDLSGLDALLFGSICDVARNLSSVFARNFSPKLHVDYIHYPQNPASPAALDWFEAELGRVLGGLAARFGKKPDEAALEEAIARQDRVRAEIRALYELRREAPARLPTFELYALLRLATALPAEEAAAVLEEARLALTAREVPARDAVRVVVEGAFCEQPPIELIRQMEEAGLAIVDDDFQVGARLFGEVPRGPERPLRRIARAFLENSVRSSVHRPAGAARPERLIERVRAARAEGVVLMAAKFCEPALLDQVLYRRALEAAKIPHLRLEFEEKQWTFERVRSEVETFVESFLFD
jgi:benzoyl-CoA reductase subunit C